MNKPTRRRVFMLIGLNLVCARVLADADRGTREEAKALADAAFDHIRKVGPDQAYNDFTHDRAAWSKKDLYVLVFNGKNVVLAHGGSEKLVGKDMSAVKDAKGRPVVVALNALAAKGGGWYDYDWPDPITKKLMLKSTYARPTPSGDGFIGVGIFR